MIRGVFRTGFTPAMTVLIFYGRLHLVREVFQFLKAVAAVEAELKGVRAHSHHGVGKEAHHQGNLYQYRVRPLKE